MNERLAHDHAELGELLGKVVAALDAKDVAQSHASLDLFWARLAVHIRAEHLFLFPAILDAPSKSRENAVSESEALKAVEELRQDHHFFMRELSLAVATTRGLLTTADKRVVEEQLKDTRAKIGVVEARLSKHNKAEEEGVYRWTGSLLSEAEQSVLAAGMQRELENIPPRFAAQ